MTHDIVIIHGGCPPGEPNTPLSISLFTWNPGAMSLIAMWQPNNKQ